MAKTITTQFGAQAQSKDNPEEPLRGRPVRLNSHTQGNAKAVGKHPKTATAKRETESAYEAGEVFAEAGRREPRGCPAQELVQEQQPAHAAHSAQVQSLF